MSVGGIRILVFGFVQRCSPQTLDDARRCRIDPVRDDATQNIKCNGDTTMLLILHSRIELPRRPIHDLELIHLVLQRRDYRIPREE